MRKQIGTNSRGRLFEILLKSVLPIFLIAALLSTGSLSAAATRLLKVSAALSSPDDAARIIRDNMYAEKSELPVTPSAEEKKASDSEALPTASVTNEGVPQDIAALIAEAEQKYAQSPNDGEIIEADYSIKNATSEFDGIYVRNTTKNHTVDIEQLLKGKIHANISRGEPSVLIYHTHTSETYELLDRGFYTNARSSRSENSAENMVRVGEEICEVLEKNGFKTIHDKTVYDEKYSGAYDRSREHISQILKDNPSIQIVLDVHRDAIYQKDGSRIKPVMVSNGRKTAQIMIISGCEDGNVTGFPNWEKNLTFAVQLQQQLTKDNPGLMRPLMFCDRKYNMDLIPCALLVEFGSDANTLSEAVYSAQLFAQSLSKLLKEY